MPELPEVETIVRQLKPSIEGRIIEKTRINRLNQWVNPRRDRKLVNGNRIINVSRRAKYIDLALDNGHHLIIHLRMTGKLMLKDAGSDYEPYTRTVFYLDDKTRLCFMDTRTLGRLEVIGDDQHDAYFKKCGIEPLSEDFQIDALRRLVLNSKQQIKDFLLDQSKIAGIGNIYANEIMFRCGIHPERRTFRLNETDIQLLFRHIPDVLSAAIARMGTTLGNKVSDYRNVYNIDGDYQNMLKVYGRTNLPCSECGTPIKRIVQKGRSSFYCEKCQI
ncbi:MAG: DNA-formamidopyrimidine glycosylase [candidate division KSB1 bacterium]|jgi:formamidopyrimidine-DNA glycosylase|nr:DNA-formamidopyrimidine glycosylase [candidate division KSB1 bacterium]